MSRNGQKGDLRQYEEAWAGMMVRIWRDRITQLRAFRTGRLLESVELASLATSPDGIEADIRFRFVRYGLLLDAGRRPEGGDGGSIGRRRWFSPSWAISRRVLLSAAGRIAADELRGIVATLEE